MWREHKIEQTKSIQNEICCVLIPYLVIFPMYDLEIVAFFPEPSSCRAPNRWERFNSAPEEKAMAPHSSTLAWKIPWMEEPCRLQSMGSLRVRHDWATSLSLFTFMHWRRKWQLTPMFLPGEPQGQRSLVGCRLWGCTELDTTHVI